MAYHVMALKTLLQDAKLISNKFNFHDVVEQVKKESYAGYSYKGILLKEGDIFLELNLEEIDSVKTVLVKAIFIYSLFNFLEL